MDEADLHTDQDFARKLSRVTYSPVWSLSMLVALLGGLVIGLLYNMSWVDHTNRVIEQGLLVEKTLLDLQTATRGYYLTGDRALLQPYINDKPSLNPTLTGLSEMVADNPPQHELVSKITTGSRTWLAIVTQTLAEQDASAGKPANSVIYNARAKFDQTQNDITAFLQNEFTLRDRRSQMMRRFGWFTLLAAGVATAIVAYLQCRGMRSQLRAINAVYRQVLSRLKERNVRVSGLLVELDQELKTVGEIQRSLLPLTLPSIPGLEVAASYQTSQRAGGDYYDFFRLPPESPDDMNAKYGILIADVSGHGTPAAVLMAVTHSIAHGFERPTTPPNELLAFVNHRLAHTYTKSNGSFVTAFYAIYNPETRHISYSSAGHNPPRLRRSGEDHFTALDDAQGLPLGVSGEEVYPIGEVTLEPGDTLVLYTDGITEAYTKGLNFLGVEGLDAALAKGGDASAMLESVTTAVRDFAGETPTDDRTLLIFRALKRTTTITGPQQSVVVETVLSPLISEVQ